MSQRLIQLDDCDRSKNKRPEHMLAPAFFYARLERETVSRLASLQRLASVQLADVHSRCHFYKTRVALESPNAVTLTTRDGSKSFPQDFFAPNRGTAATWDSFRHELFNSGMVCASERCSRHARLCREFSSRVNPDYERQFVHIKPRCWAFRRSA